MPHLKKLIHLKDYEKMEKVVRRDKIILIMHLLLNLVLFLIPLGLYVLFSEVFPAILADALWHPIIILVMSVYYLFVWVLFFAGFLDYYLDIWIITNDRLLNIEQEGIFARTISELDLYKIQDTTSDVKGIFPYLFGYGSVHIQTAGKEKRFEMKQVPRSHELRKLIMDLAEADRKYHKNIV